MIKVGFAGMTHLGLVSAAAAASRGFHVVAYDGDEAAIAALNSHKLPVVEPGLPELIAANRSQLKFTAQTNDLASCDVVYVAADVPTDDDGVADLDPIRALIEQMGMTVASHSILVVLSQVPPGFMRALTFDQTRLFYQVETLVFGRAIERATCPERFIIGCAEPSRPLPESYAELLKAFSCPILPMRYESAELAKISINFFLVASVSATNTLAEISEIVGADWAEIAPALRLDKRIGAHAYLTPGLGIAGGNLERDLRAILSAGEEADTGVVKAWLENSAHRKDWLWRVLRDHVFSSKSDARIALLGLAYKENTHSIKNSPSLALLGHLKGLSVTVHDPVVPASVVPWAQSAADALAATAGADALVIATPWPEYRALSPDALARRMTGRIIIDPYRMLDGKECAAAGFAYHTLGMAPLAPRTGSR